MAIELILLLLFTIITATTYLIFKEGKIRSIVEIIWFLFVLYVAIKILLTGNGDI